MRKTKKKEFILALTGMVGSYLLYKILSLIILYNTPKLQEKPYYQFIYFGIVFIITLGLTFGTKKYFNQSINLSCRLNKQSLLIFIVPIILFGLDAIFLLPSLLTQGGYLLIVSILSSLGASLFEEVRDRGFGIIAMSKSLPDSKWKPLLLAVITSIIFSLTHYFNLLLPFAPSLEATNQQVFQTFFMGMCFSVLTLKTGTIFWGILFHFLNNWTIWTPTSDLSSVTPWFSVIIIYGIIPLIYSVWYLKPRKSIKEIGSK